MTRESLLKHYHVNLYSSHLFENNMRHVLRIMKQKNNKYVGRGTWLSSNNSFPYHILLRGGGCKYLGMQPWENIFGCPRTDWVLYNLVSLARHAFVIQRRVPVQRWCGQLKLPIIWLCGIWCFYGWCYHGKYWTSDCAKLSYLSTGCRVHPRTEHSFNIRIHTAKIGGIYLSVVAQKHTRNLCICIL